MPEPVIRPARPEDVEAAVPLIYSAGPTAFDYVFSYRTQMDAHGFLAHAFTRPSGGFSYRWHSVITVDDAVAGIAAGYTGRDALTFTLPAIGQIFRCYGLLSGTTVIARGLRIERIVPPPKGAGCFYIANVGITPQLRGKGLGARLFAHLHEAARERGATTLALDVSVENPRAEALYTRLGYRVVREMASTLENDTGHVPNHRRMEQRLPD